MRSSLGAVPLGNLYQKMVNLLTLRRFSVLFDLSMCAGFWDMSRDAYLFDICGYKFACFPT